MFCLFAGDKPLELQCSACLQVISPGMVQTEIMLAAGFKVPPGQTVDYLYKDIPHLQSQDIADAVTYALGTPPRVQVSRL